MSKTFKKYSRIIKFLEDHYPDLYEIIDGLGMYSLFTPKKNAGITFLIPTEANQKKICKIARGENADDAIKIIKAHIIVDHLQSPADWDQKSDDIPNLLKKRLIVSRCTTSGVALRSGAVLRINSTFTPIDSRKNMAIWDVVKGSVSVDGPTATFKYVKSKKKGATVEPPKIDFNRSALLTKLDNKYIRSGKEDCFIQYMATLMNMVKNDNKELYLTIRPMLDASALVSFHILVEPLKPNNGQNYIIPNFIVSKCRPTMPNPLKSWKSHFKSDKTYEDLKETARNIRNNTLDEVSKKQIAHIISSYDDFDNGGGLSQFLPTPTVDFYKSRPGLKKWQDSARHLIRRAYSSNSRTRTDTISTMFNRYRPGKMNTIITDMAFFKGTRGSAAIYQSLVLEFINSDLFMYFMRTPDIEDDASSEDNDDYINHSAITWNNQEECQGREIDERDIIFKIRILQEDKPEKFQKIMKHFGYIPEPNELEPENED